MEARLTCITLGVSDLARARRFYEDVLGWKASSASVGDVVFFAAGGLVVALYPRTELAKDAHLAAEGSGFAGVALAHNVRNKEDVDAVLREIEARGGKILKPAEDAFWGGRSGYFADADGYAWEVAWNPGWPLDERGVPQLPA